MSLARPFKAGQRIEMILRRVATIDEEGKLPWPIPTHLCITTSLSAQKIVNHGLSRKSKIASGPTLAASPDINQRAHHQKKTFQEEYRELLKKHDVDYDERYLWG
jgi:hypothetical protein